MPSYGPKDAPVIVHLFSDFQVSKNLKIIANGKFMSKVSGL